MMKKIRGIMPVMLTPFTQNDTIDWNGLDALIDWYIEHGAEALFAVCQSSEMQFLSLQERCDLARYTVKKVAGKIPVIASGHVSTNVQDQLTELKAMAETGVDAIVLVTNRLDPENHGFAVLRKSVDCILSNIPEDIPMGIYECPSPFRRLLTNDEIKYLADNPRFVTLKDVSCDLGIIKQRLKLVRGSNLLINNANAAIAHQALLAGADGFCGVFNNFHPDLYRWLQDNWLSHPALAKELAVFLALAASTEYMGYPKLAKIYHQRLGTFKNSHSRALNENIHEKFWAVDEILEKISAGTAHYRNKISALET